MRASGLHFSFATMFAALVTASALCQATERHTVPDSEALADAEQRVEQEFGKQLATAVSRADKSALATRFLGVAQETRIDHAGRYALYMRVMELLTQAGDTWTAMETAREIAQDFAVDGLVLQADAVERCAKAADDENDHHAIVEAALLTLHRAAGAERFDLTTRMATCAEDAAGRRSGSLDELELALLARANEREDAYRRIEPALEALTRDPDDPDLNRAVGEYLCFVQERWDEGLEMLVGGSDTRLAYLAKTDLAAPKDPIECSELADRWWSQAQTRGPLERPAILKHAASWYRNCVDGLRGLERAVAETRLQHVRVQGQTAVGTARAFARAGSRRLAALELEAARAFDRALAIDVAEIVEVSIPEKYAARKTGRGALRDSRAVEAVAVGLEWLARHQDREGRWDSDGFMKHDLATDACDGPGKPVHDVGITGLALLAFLAEGNTHRHGEHAAVVERGVTWLCGQQDPDSGLFATRSHHQFIYDHLIATVAIIEAYGLGPLPALGGNAERAIAYVEGHRNPDGAWRYGWQDGDNDVSVTAWALQTCIAARDFGLDVSLGGLEDAGEYLDEMTEPDSGRTGYVYRGGPSGRNPGEHAQRYPQERGEAMTAVALLCRAHLGNSLRDPLIRKQVRLLHECPPEWDPEAGTIDLYYWYHAAQALALFPRYWKAWSEALVEALTSSQRQDGSFRGTWDPVGVWCEDGGRVYATAMAVLALQAPYRFGDSSTLLPIPNHPAFRPIREAWLEGDIGSMERARRRLRGRRYDESALMRIDELIEAKILAAMERVQQLTTEPDRLAAEEELELIASNYQGLAPAASAERVLDRFRADEEIRREIAASKALRALTAREATTPSTQRRLQADLERLARRYEGTLAAARAKEMLEGLPK